MPDYEALYYKSQAALADAIEALEQLTAALKSHMSDSEEAVISHEPTDAP